MAIESPVTSDDHVFIGEDKSIVFTIYQSDGDTLQDITGWSLSWMLKASLADADVSALLTKTNASGITLTTPTSGVCTVSIADTDTDGIAAGRYVHELKRTDSASETVLAYGAFVLRRGVHRS